MYRTHSPEQTAALAARVGAWLRAGDTVFLIGDLGAGKSVFARGVAAALGIHEAMASPTFTLMYPYSGRCPLYHFDLYRLSDSEEFWQAGLDEFISGDGVALVEWPDRADFPTGPRLEVFIDRCEADGDREIELRFFDMDDREGAIQASLAGGF